MKKSLLIVQFLFLTVLLFAQERYDKVLMVNEEVKTGKVVGISELSIDFIHQGESLKYTLKKTEISKIEFGSGRIEVFNEVKSTDKDQVLLDHHNKVAVLPFIYIRNGQQLKNDAMERKVQQEFVTLMSGHLGVIKAQPTNQPTNQHDQLSLK